MWGRPGRSWGCGGGKNDGMRPPGGKRGSLKSGVLTTSVGEHKVG